MADDASDDYRKAAEQLADLAARMISLLADTPERSLGGRWREEASATLSRFRAAQAAKRQRVLFED